jgi:hypothetical protein
MLTALDLATIDASWDEEPSGVRARPQRKPPLPVQAMPTEAVAALYLLTRFELEDRLDSGQRLRVELDGDVFEVVRVADRFDAEGRFVAKGGLRVERKR